jgi:hypothetical protein
MVLSLILKLEYVPISGTLDIETRDYKTFVGANQVADTQAFLKMLLSPIQLLALCRQ